MRTKHAKKTRVGLWGQLSIWDVTNAEQVVLDYMEKWDRRQSKGGESGHFGRPNPPEMVD